MPMYFSSFQSLGRVRLFATPWTAAHQASLSITNSTQTHVIESVISSNHLIPLLSPSPPALNLSIRVFSNESALRIRQPKYWSFSFNINPSNEHPGLIFCKEIQPCSPRDSPESSPTVQFKSIYQYLHTICSCFFAHTLTHKDIHTDTKTKRLKLGLFPSSLESLSQWKSYFQMVWNLLHKENKEKQKEFHYISRNQS